MFYSTSQASGVKFIKILSAEKVVEVAAGVINSNNYMVTHSFFKNGETIQDGFDDKIYIHVDFNFKSDVKVLGCSWNGQCWYSLLNNHCYMDGIASLLVFCIVVWYRICSE